jgi:hypothetical protein
MRFLIWGDTVKKLLAMAAASVLIFGIMMIAGCSGNNVGTSPSLPETVQGAAGAGAQSAAEPMQVDSASNGGSSLAAASPYAGDGKSTAQQNVNPTPFLQASSPMKAGMTMPAVSATTLVSRADGTMYGPTDMSPAGAGPGAQGMSASAGNQGATAKPAAAAKPATKTATPQ